MWNLPPSDSVLHVLSIIALAAQAMSAALAAGRRSMDWVGVCLLGAITALKINDELWTALTFVLGLALRLLAIRFKWEMPKFVLNGEAL